MVRTLDAADAAFIRGQYGCLDKKTIEKYFEAKEYFANKVEQSAPVFDIGDLEVVIIPHADLTGFDAHL